LFRLLFLARTLFLTFAESAAGTCHEYSFGVKVDESRQALPFSILGYTEGHNRFKSTLTLSSLARETIQLVVILQPQMRDQRLSPQVAQRVLELHRLDKQIMLRIEPRRCHRRFQVEAQPFLDAQPFQFVAALGQVKEKHQVQNDGRSQNRIAAKEVNL